MKVSNMIWELKYKRRSLLASYCYNRGFVKLPYSPQEVFVEPTNYCNLKCIICPHNAGLKREKGFMPLNSFKRILKEIKNANVLKITLHFAGESLLNKDLLDMIILAKKNKLYIRFHTNATLLSQEQSYKLINSGLDELSFSFDDPNKEVYEKIRENASFEKTLANIKMFLKIKKSLKAQKPYTIIQRIKLSNFNYSAYDDLEYHRLFDNFTVDRFYTIPTHNWGGTCAGSFIEKYSGSLIKSPCTAIWSRFSIGWNGKAYACCNDMEGKLFIGDLNTTGLLDVWNGPQMLKLRNMMLSSRYEEIGICKDCDVLLRTKREGMSKAKADLARLFLFLQRV